MDDRPGIHRKFAHYGYDKTIYTAKYVSSTARWSGAQRTLCEAFGVRNFHSGLAGQKLINDFLAAMGINLINDNTLLSIPWPIVAATSTSLYRGGGFTTNSQNAQRDCRGVLRPLVLWQHVLLFSCLSLPFGVEPG